MNVISRRTMVRQSTMVAAAFSTSAFTRCFAARGKRYKIGACDWSIGKMADPAAFKVANEIGLDGVQVSLGTVGDNMKLRQPAVQQSYKEAARAASVEIASLAIGEMNNIPYKSDPRTEAWVSDGIDVMQALGLKTVLLAFFSKGDLVGDEEGQKEVIRRLKKVAPKAEKAGVVLGLESWLSAEDTVRIMDQVGSPAVKMYYDVRNSTDRGYNITKEIRWLGKERICEFHLKENGCLLGQGQIDFAGVHDALESIQYEDWMQIEGGLPPNGDIVESTRKNLHFLRGIFESKA